MVSELEHDNVCRWCGAWLPPDDPEVPGLVYCEECGRPASYDR